MQFQVYRDNGGGFHWRLVGDDGAMLAVSAVTFTRPEDAHRSAGDVRAQAGAAAASEA
jgi:uncharacterized protein YegP (UPF0339 family)